MTIEELIDKWGDLYIIESRIRDTDYEYETGYLERLSTQENRFIEDLKKALAYYYDGGIIIDTGNNRRKRLSLIEIDQYNWDSIFIRVNTNITSEPIQQVKNMIDLLKDAGKRLRGSFRWKLPSRVLDVGKFKGEFVEDQLIPGSDLRIKSNIIPLDPECQPYKNPDKFYARTNWITSRRRYERYEVKEDYSYYNYKTGMQDIKTRLIDRTTILYQYRFNLKQLAADLRNTTNEMRVRISGIELKVGNLLTETLTNDIQIPSDPVEFDKIVEDNKNKTAEEIGDTLKRSDFRTEGNVSKYNVIPYENASYYDKNFNILEIIKPSKFVELPTSINSTTALN